jgi:hypothetical protein
MNIFNKQVASYTSIILIFCGVLVSCATKTTSENTLPDTTHNDYNRSYTTN